MFNLLKRLFHKPEPAPEQLTEYDRWEEFKWETVAQTCYYFRADEPLPPELLQDWETIRLQDPEFFRKNEP